MRIQRYSVFVWVDKGTFEVFCSPAQFGSNTIVINFKSDDSKVHFNTPISTVQDIKDLLLKTEVPQTEENIQMMKKSSELVRMLANAESGIHDKVDHLVYDGMATIRDGKVFGSVRP